MTTGRKWICAVVLLALLAGAVVCLKPKYDAFVQADYQESCFQAMDMIAIWYHYAIRESMEAGKKPEEIDYEDLLRRVISVHYAMTVNDHLESDDFCRAGGHVRIFLDPVTHAASMSCDYPGHDVHYTDEHVTEGFLDNLENIDSGLQILGK